MLTDTFPAICFHCVNEFPMDYCDSHIVPCIDGFSIDMLPYQSSPGCWVSPLRLSDSIHTCMHTL